MTLLSRAGLTFRLLSSSSATQMSKLPRPPVASFHCSRKALFSEMRSSCTTRVATRTLPRMSTCVAMYEGMAMPFITMPATGSGERTSIMTVAVAV